MEIIEKIRKFGKKISYIGRIVVYIGKCAKEIPQFSNDKDQ